MKYVYIVHSIEDIERETFDRAFVNIGSVRAWVDAEIAKAEFPDECRPLLQVTPESGPMYWEAVIDFGKYIVRREPLYY